MNGQAIAAFVEDILRTREFQRLRGVSFLGILDRHASSTLRGYRSYSRAEHSLGVLTLSLNIASDLHLSDEDALVMVAASLTHDLAHPAFSHSLEYAFRPDERTLDHHTALRNYLRGTNSRFRQVSRILREYDIDPMRVYAVVSGEDELGFFFVSPINVDTIDGISRSLWSRGRMAPYNVKVLTRSLARLFSGEQISSPSFFREADRFWREKNGFYNQFLSGAAAGTERSFQEQVRLRIDSLDQSLFEMSDRDFVHVYPDIIYNTESTSRSSTGPKQSFDIDESISSVDKLSIYDRYRRTRHAS